jgi:hypothetical protein
MTLPDRFFEFTDIDSEIGFLSSIIDYYARIKKYPFFDHIAADDFIKYWLQVDVTFSQMADAIL